MSELQAVVIDVGDACDLRVCDTEYNNAHVLSVESTLERATHEGTTEFEESRDFIDIVVTFRVDCGVE